MRSSATRLDGGDRQHAGRDAGRPTVDGRAAAARGGVGVGEHLLAADRLDRVVGPAAGGLADLPRRRRRRRATAWVAPSSRASSSFSGTTSTATSVPAPGQHARRAAPRGRRRRARRPRRSRRPATRRALTAAPTPVSTAQPNSAATSKGSVGSTFTAERVGDDDVLGEGGDAEVVVSGPPPRSPCQRRSPDSSVPAALAAAPGSQSAARPAAARARTRRRRARRRGRRGRPARSRRRLGPTSTTSPAASWPSTIGITRGREPSITDRSEWHRPAARTRTSSSPGPGGASSSSAISSGRDSRVGRAAAPISRSTAPRIFIARRAPAARGAARSDGRDRRRAARSSRSTNTCTNQPSRPAPRRPAREQADLVARRSSGRAGRPAAPPRRPRGTRAAPSERAVRLGAEPDHLAAVDVEPALGDQPGLITVSKNA